MKEKLARLKRLQTALASLKAANDIKSRVSTAKELTAILKDLGVFNLESPQGVDDDYSDNANADNYRYADTGHITGAHKERASNRIKELAKEGQTVKSTDIEWDEIESDALLAEDLIKKSNILGDVDYQLLKDADVDAGTALMIQKVLASVGAQPHWDLGYFLKNSKTGNSITRNLYGDTLLRFMEALDSIGTDDQKRTARKAYVIGINSLKSRIINKTSVKDLVDELKLMREEMGGFKVNDLDSQGYQDEQVVKDALTTKIRSSSARYKEEYENAAAAAMKEKDLNVDNDSTVQYLAGEWSVRPKHKYDFRPDSAARWLNNKYPNLAFRSAILLDEGEVITSEDWNELLRLKHENELRWSKNAIKALQTDTTSLAWLSLGERFWNIIELTSGAFVKHANYAIAGKYDDWSLVIKDVNPNDSKKTGGKKRTTFELIVADKIERKGGAKIDVKSTGELKSAFGFREIQSGNWVLKDKASAKFHVENAAAAMMDLSDVVGIDANSLAFGGRLALAFGARGRSGALAHYEPVQRVINITKMKGGGSLGHEWFHAIDNILGEVLNIDGATGSQVFLSSNPELLGDSDLGRAFSELRSAMRDGDTREPLTFKVTQEGIDLAKRNMNPNTLYGTNAFIAANDLETSIIHLNEKLEKRRLNKKNHAAWVSIALGYHRKDDVGQTITLNVGMPMSNYLAQSKALDAGRSKPYWSTTLEMAARAFQAYLEDSLQDQDRRNDYLSFGANNDLYGGKHKAYPAGEERKRINAVFKRLFATIKDQRVFENAASNTAMMDSIFGEQTAFVDLQEVWEL